MLWAMTLCSLSMGLELFPLKVMDSPSVYHPIIGRKLSLRYKDCLLFSVSEAVGSTLPFVAIEMPEASC